MGMTHAAPGRLIGELPLAGGGEPVDLARTLASHGVATLPPQRVDPDARTLETTLALGNGRARTVRIRAGRPGHVAVEVTGSAQPTAAARRSSATRSGPATGASTCCGWPATSRTASLTWNGSGTRSCPIPRSCSACSRCPAWGRTLRRT
jgi:hypothetical protein